LRIVNPHVIKHSGNQQLLFRNKYFRVDLRRVELRPRDEQSVFPAVDDYAFGRAETLYVEFAGDAVLEFHEPLPHPQNNDELIFLQAHHPSLMFAIHSTKRHLSHLIRFLFSDLLPFVHMEEDNAHLQSLSGNILPDVLSTSYPCSLSKKGTIVDRQQQPLKFIYLFFVINA